MRGVILPFPHTPSWCGAELKKKSTGTTLALPMTREIVQHPKVINVR
jgi:hypothetical protein